MAGAPTPYGGGTRRRDADVVARVLLLISRFLKAGETSRSADPFLAVGGCLGTLKECVYLRPKL